MPKRRSTRRSTAARTKKRGKPRPKRKHVSRSRTHPTAKRKARSAATKKRRSAAAKKGWAKRRKKQRLIDAMHDSNWREIALPTRDELYDYMTWMSEQFEVEISDMYRLYFGYDVGESMAAE